MIRGSVLKCFWKFAFSLLNKQAFCLLYHCPPSDDLVDRSFEQVFSYHRRIDPQEHRITFLYKFIHLLENDMEVSKVKGICRGAVLEKLLKYAHHINQRIMLGVGGNIDIPKVWVMQLPLKINCDVLATGELLQQGEINMGK